MEGRRLLSIFVEEVILIPSKCSFVRLEDSGKCTYVAVGITIPESRENTSGITRETPTQVHEIWESIFRKVENHLNKK